MFSHPSSPQNQLVNGEQDFFNSDFFNPGENFTAPSEENFFRGTVSGTEQLYTQSLGFPQANPSTHLVAAPRIPFDESQAASLVDSSETTKTKQDPQFLASDFSVSSSNTTPPRKRKLEDLKKKKTCAKKTRAEEKALLEELHNRSTALGSCLPQELQSVLHSAPKERRSRADSTLTILGETRDIMGAAQLHIKSLEKQVRALRETHDQRLRNNWASFFVSLPSSSEAPPKPAAQQLGPPLDFVDRVLDQIEPPAPGPK